jgi:hypothetical protein
MDFTASKGTSRRDDGVAAPARNNPVKILSVLDSGTWNNLKPAGCRHGRQKEHHAFHDPKLHSAASCSLSRLLKKFLQFKK